MLDMLTLREKHEYEEEIAQLKAELSATKDKLVKSERCKSKWKVKCEQFTGVKLTKTARARLMVASSKDLGFSGNITEECNRIAVAVKVKGSTVRQLWY